jgi:hypothetical protein
MRLDCGELCDDNIAIGRIVDLDDCTSLFGGRKRLLIPYASAKESLVISKRTTSRSENHGLNE